MKVRLPTIRRVVQVVLLAAFTTLVCMASWKRASTFPFDVFQRLDPLLSLQAALAGRVWIPALGAGLGLLGLTLVFGRIFCGWMCPLGTCLEVGDDLIFGRRARAWKNGERRLRGLKYAFLLAILGAAALGQGLVFWLDPITWATRLIGLALWPMGLGMSAFLLRIGRPFLDDLGWMGLARAEIPVAYVDVLGFASLAFLVGVLALGHWQRRLWCRALCPLGALLAIPARFSLVQRRVSRERCDRAKPCALVCETGCVEEDPERFDAGECIQCLRCLHACRPGATTFKPGLSAVGNEPSFDLSRRQALGALGAGVAAGAWLALDPNRKEQAGEVLRPPGALPEDDFLATCVRCGLCMRACPTGCLRPGVVQTGVAGVFTPSAVMRIGPCDPNCTACGEVCPTGAIRRIENTDKAFARIGVAVIEPRRCVAWEQERECLVCDENCPWGAIEWFDMGGTGQRVPRVEAPRCNGCGQCEHACPVGGESAIRVRGSGQIRLKEGSYAEKASELGIEMGARNAGDG